MVAGVSTNGFTTKTVDEVVTSINARVHADVDATLDLTPNEPLGQIIGIFSEQIGELWELGSQLYHMLDRDGAEGVTLDNVGAIVGTDRLPAVKTQVAVAVNLNAGVTLPLGSRASVVGRPDLLFEIVAAVTNPDVSPANIDAVFDAVDTGPIAAPAGTLTEIVTPVAGWNAITNALDGETGLNVETDTAYRTRQDAELFAGGSSSTSSLRAKILKVPGVLECSVRENDTDNALDPDGGGVMPAHSIECIIWDGVVPSAVDSGIAQIILDHKGAGATVIGASTAGAVDKMGVAHTVRFSRATQVPIYLTLTQTVYLQKYAGDAAVKAYIVAQATAKQKIGVDVVALFYHALVTLASPYLGVDDVPSFGIGLSMSPVTTANLAITTRQIAVFDTSRIVLL